MASIDSAVRDQPHGELAIRTVAMPADANANGDIFGGWLLAQMDIAGGITAKRRADGRVVTVAIQSMAFHRLVFIGDVLCAYADLIKIGRTSMVYRIEAWVIRHHDGSRVKVTEGEFTYVAVDADRRPRAVPADAGADDG